MVFTKQEILRYNRHFPVIGLEGQEKLKRAKLLCIGVGGLGCPALLYLVAAGIGEIGIADGDRVDMSNLSRQILFTEKDVGKEKAACAKEHLMAYQCGVTINLYPFFLDVSNAKDVIKDYDIVLDCTDNYKSRYAINKFCKRLNKPLVAASIFQYDAQIAVFNDCQGPCYQCLYPESPPGAFIPNCAEAGVLGILPGIAGVLQATEALKIILDLGDVLNHRFLNFNLLTMEFSHYPMSHDANCRVCRGTALEEEVEGSAKEKDCQRSCENLQSSKVFDLEPFELQQWLREKRNFYLFDVREPYEREIYHIGGTLLPLQQIKSQIPQLPKEAVIVCYCKAGGRSLRAAHEFLLQGYSQVYSLKGGVLSWIEMIDPQASKY